MKKISNVFYITIGLIILTVGYGAFAPENFDAVTTNVKNFVASSFGWYYMLLMSFMLALSFFFIISPYGKIRLGKDTDRPQFSTVTWVAMLFSAGMGIGLVFYGAAEPFHTLQSALLRKIQIRMQPSKKPYVSLSSTGDSTYGPCTESLHYLSPSSSSVKENRD